MGVTSDTSSAPAGGGLSTGTRVKWGVTSGTSSAPAGGGLSTGTRVKWGLHQTLALLQQEGV